jgi:hypothetical protein
MRELFGLFLLLFFVVGSSAQNKLDSLSRDRADLVMSLIIPQQSNIGLLYSISDEFYYVLYKNDGALYAYYVQMDSIGNIAKKKKLSLSKKEKRTLSKYLCINKYIYIYKIGYLTHIDDAIILQGSISCFVVKDNFGN